MNSGEAERLWKLQTSANSLMLEGKREAESLIQFLQKFVFGTDLSMIWTEVYKLLGLATELEELIKSNPVKDNPNLWFVPVIKGVTPNKVVAALRKSGVDTYLWTEDLDKDVPSNDRDPISGSYWVGLAKNEEADPEFASMSADQLVKAGHRGITLLERLLLELGYFLATGKHLDVNNWTLCTGSRDRDGYVPGAGWHSDSRRVCVVWYDPGDASSALRSRSVVSVVSCLRSEA